VAVVVAAVCALAVFWWVWG